MKETSFIEQNKVKWKRFQDLAATKQGDPEELADLYSDITDDLSYAQTFYNRRTVRVYLNQGKKGAPRFGRWSWFVAGGEAGRVPEG